MNSRIEKLQKLLAKDGVDGGLYATSANLQYFLDDTSFKWQRTPETGGVSGFGLPENGHFLNKADCILYVPTDGEPVLVMTYDRARDMGHINMKKEVCYYVLLGDALRAHLKGKRIACGESCQDHLKAIVREIDPGIEVVKGEQYGEELRKVKDAREIATLRKLAKFTDQAMLDLIPSLKPGNSPRDIQNLLVKYAVDHGLTDIPFPATCHCTLTDAPGAEDLSGYPKDRPISTGTALAFDFGYCIDGYSSDFGRSFYYGRPETSISDAYKALQEAQLHLLDTIKPGMKMDLCFRTLHEIMEKHGCGKYLRNYGNVGLMGHQIGIDVHERPWLHDKTEATFEPGMIMCIEPKYWRPGKAYLRVEDMVLITETGCESLTEFDRQLFELPS